MDRSSEISWPPEYIELKRIEELLKCGICYEYIETTVMTPCSHNYCSLCIRKYLHYKTQCPACFQNTFETDLHTNRILDEIIVQFLQVRAKLMNMISGAIKVQVTENNYANKSKEVVLSQPVEPSTAYENPKTPLKSTNGFLQASKTPIKFFANFSPSCSSRETNCAPKNEVLVACPVCNVGIPQIHVNKHLDECLKRDSIPQVAIRVELKRKPLPKLVFNLMKDSELKKKMKEHGLATQGDRKTLENRFQRYCILYNAECDKTSPRSIAELLRQCKDEEAVEKKMQKPTANWIKVSRNAEQTIIDEANKKYLEVNAESYSNLIKSMKSRKTFQKSLVLNETAKVETIPCQTSETIENIDQSNTQKTPTIINDSSADIFDQITDESSDSEEADCQGKERPGEERKDIVEDNERLGAKKLVPSLIGQDFIDSSSSNSSVDIDDCITRPSNIAVFNKDNDHQVSVNDHHTYESRPTRKRNHPSRFGSELNFI